MSKFLLITKINLLRSFNSTIDTNLKYKSARRKKIIKGIIISLIVVYILFYVYFITNSLMPTFIEINKPLYILAFLFSICSIYIFVANIFKIKTVLFNFKDYDLLMSLPVSRNIVIASKITSLYITNFLCTLVVMIPGYLAYIKYANLSHDWLFFILLLAIPIIPILASSIIGILISWITSFFKNKNLGSYIIYTLLIVLIFFGMYKINGLDETVIANSSINIVERFSNYYPLTNVFIELLDNYNVISLLIYFIMPIILTIVFFIIINYSYIKIRTRLLKQNVKSDYILKRYRINSPIVSLYKKELKRYLASPLYVLNTSFGCIIMFLIILSILLFNDNVISRFDHIISLNEMVKNNIVIVLTMLCVLSSTTNSSISLEGKSLWIMKMLPVSYSQVYVSKILVNLTILIPTILISGTFFGIYLHFSLIDFIFLYLIMFVYSLFASINGLLLNIIFPKFDYDNEVKVIKQSMAVFLTILTGIIVVLVPFRLFGMSSSSIILITSIMFLVDILFVIILHVYGDRKMSRL